MDFFSKEKINTNKQSLYGVLSRRKFLFRSLTMTFIATRVFNSSILSAGTAAYAALSAPNEALIPFAHVSQLLVGPHKLEAHIVLSAWNALNIRFTDFSEQFSLLNNEIKKNKISSIEQLKNTAIFTDPIHKNTIMQIVSAYYLGRVGDTNNISSENRPEFITYAEAIMWDLTRNVSVIPTYSQGSPGYWVVAPTLNQASLKNINVKQKDK